MPKYASFAAAYCIVAVLACTLPVFSATSGKTYFGFFELYEANRREGVPNYITEDFLARVYAMLVEDAATSFEEGEAIPALLELGPLLRAEIGVLTELERAAQNFLSVFEALLVGAEAAQGAPDPATAAQEIRAVEEGRGIARSPLLRQKIDYSQFQVRGKYTRSPELSRYFRAVRYAGTALFPLLHSQATGIGADDADLLTGAALLISKGVAGNAQAAELYARANDPLDYLFGEPDAMTIAQYAKVAPEDPGRLRLGYAALPRLRLGLFAAGVRPRVLGAPIDDKKLEPGVQPTDVLAGWQFLPSRLTPESAAFQDLVFDRVGGFLGDGQPFTMGMIDGRPAKAFPSVLELAALLGSDEAEVHLRRTGDTNYEGYTAAQVRASRAMESSTGLASEHFILLRNWLRPAKVGDPLPAPGRRLNTSLGFWALQRHVAVLHAKQSYTPTAKGLAPAAPKRSQAWIEPAESLYRALASSAQEVADRMEFDPLARYARILYRCADLSAQVLAGKPFDAGQVTFLNNLDASLKQLTRRKDELVAVDFHTDGNSGHVAEIALGPPQVVEIDLPGDARGRGGLFRVHQFKQPLDERLDDKAWTQRVARGETPPPLFEIADWLRAGATFWPKQ